jgi:ABC-type transport system involved in multi-copper enzyme maturation permease subunit
MKSWANIKTITKRELGAYLGSWLMAGAYLAISCMTSALTRSQVVSFILSVVACLFLILAGFPPVINFLQQLVSPSLVDMVIAGFRLDLMEGRPRLLS